MIKEAGVGPFMKQLNVEIVLEMVMAGQSKHEFFSSKRRPTLDRPKQCQTVWPDAYIIFFNIWSFSTNKFCTIVYYFWQSRNKIL